MLYDNETTTLQKELQNSLNKLKDTFESLFVKYGKEFYQDEIIDVFTGEIVEQDEFSQEEILDVYTGEMDEQDEFTMGQIGVFTGEMAKQEEFTMGQIEELSDSESVKSEFAGCEAGEDFLSGGKVVVEEVESACESTDIESLVSDFEQAGSSGGIISKRRLLPAVGDNNKATKALVERKIILLENSISNKQDEIIGYGTTVSGALETMYRKLGVQFSLVYSETVGAGKDYRNSLQVAICPKSENGQNSSLAQPMYSGMDQPPLGISLGIQPNNTLTKWIREVCPENTLRFKRKLTELHSQSPKYSCRRIGTGGLNPGPRGYSGLAIPNRSDSQPLLIDKISLSTLAPPTSDYFLQGNRLLNNKGFATLKYQRKKQTIKGSNASRTLNIQQATDYIDECIISD
ncbi:hypothetical protein BB561_003028 [Smittium simulii]|uniref:Uncharacterized protein n=1 Tax=Smittium simulii TaxID=133385 RepID=A0A2T9YNB6_9FUNG|nr:hypothetical protein BB561_003028 [Smittium simulii]